jgi:hypothetical protein
MDHQTSTLLSHLVSRVHQDVQLLVDLGHIDQREAESFLARLPDGQQGALIPAPPPASVPSFPVPVPQAQARSPVPPPPAPKPVRTQARALWAYNEKGTVSKLFTLVKH